MSAARESSIDAATWPRAWTWFVMALATLILCACSHTPPHVAEGYPAAQSLPPDAWSGPVPGGEHGPGVPCATCGPTGVPGYPLPVSTIAPWSPPGIKGPWPPDEYVCDGGDQDVRVSVGADWHIDGLEPEDTVAHYDTIDGRRIVEPSNCVCLYAPRFSAVRSVRGIIEDLQVQTPNGAAIEQTPIAVEDLGEPNTTLQNYQALAERQRRLANNVRLAQHDGMVSIALLPSQFRDQFLPFEDFTIIRAGMYEQAEKPRLAIAVDAAITWSADQAVQIVLDRQAATEVDGDQRAQAVFSVKPSGSPKLRLCKVASTCVALPGDEVDFTLRFDNVGTQVIGNVTIVDHLAPRLEYIEGSAQASVEANFFAEQKANTLVLRCEVINPMEPGDGGILRFKCRVR